MTGDKKNDDIWAEATRDVRPLDKSAAASKPRKTVEYTIRPRDSESPGAPSGPIHQSTFDPGLFKNIAAGKVRLDKRLDLHGMTEARANTLLIEVIEGAWAEGRRRLLVITGKGRAGGGAIRAMLPKWLSAPNLARYVSSYTHADKKHGGDGAFYVLLRRLPQDRDE